MDVNSLAGLGEGLTKPATVLIEKVSAAVGGLYRPHQIRAIAQAEADAALIRAESEVEITALHQRGFLRWVEEIADQQFNMEEITYKALPLVAENASPGDMENDWIRNFFAKCRGISDSDMQDMWARILAGEANRQGSFSRKTVNLMEDLGSADVAVFNDFCSFAWSLGGFISPVVLDMDDEMYRKNGVTYDSSMQLESLGLVYIHDITTMDLTGLTQSIRLHYFNRPLELRLSEEANNRIPVSHILFTQAGMELSRICNAKPILGFYEFASAKWEAESKVVSIRRFPEPPVS